MNYVSIKLNFKHSSYVQILEKARHNLQFSLTHHISRTAFSEKCSESSMKEKYIDTFYGQISQSVLAKNCTDYSTKDMKVQYEKIENILTLDI